jgi:hypothetical protein
LFLTPPHILKQKNRSCKIVIINHVAEVIALACSSSPDGSKRWSLYLLTEELRKKEGFETALHEKLYN